MMRYDGLFGAPGAFGLVLLHLIHAACYLCCFVGACFVDLGA